MHYQPPSKSIGGDAPPSPRDVCPWSEEFQVFLKEPGQQIEEDQSVGAQIILSTKRRSCLKLRKRDRRFKKKFILLSSKLDQVL